MADELKLCPFYEEPEDDQYVGKSGYTGQSPEEDNEDPWGYPDEFSMLCLFP